MNIVRYTVAARHGTRISLTWRDDDARPEEGGEGENAVNGRIVDASYLEEWGGVSVTGPMTMEEYFKTPECTCPENLVFGYLVRDAAPPAQRHQGPLGALYTQLIQHVRSRHLGTVVLNIDVVLDEKNDLVLQPDLSVVLRDHLDRLSGKLWGPPDLAVELLSPSTSRRDRTVKM